MKLFYSFSLYFIMDHKSIARSIRHPFDAIFDRLFENVRVGEICKVNNLFSVILLGNFV